MHRRSLPFVLLFSAAWTLACAGGKDGAPGLFDDHDQDDDGFLYADDCDDLDAHVNPDAAERCDPGDVDEDCDGKADSLDDDAEGRIATHHDADGDGYGEADETLLCEVNAEYVTDDSDCDDTDASISPEGQEVCGGVDEDCDGLEDDEDDSVDPAGFVDLYADADGDGWGGDPTDPACEAGSRSTETSGDCDDLDPETNPDGVEVCGGADENCDGETDENSAEDASSWYRDNDGDDYGDADGERVACEAPSGFVEDATDCDDSDADVHPGAAESCDEVDEDCNGSVDDDAVDAGTWYEDADGDGFGERASTQESCSRPTGYVADSTDCDDTSASVNPDGREVCDAADTDEDCDSVADDLDDSTAASGRVAYYADDDGDGYGDDAVTYLLCDAHSGFVTDDTDCDDTSPTAHPGGTEVCDSGDTDEDCDGDADDDDSSVSVASLSDWYRDADSDGYGTASTTLARCNRPTGYVSANTDCDDTTSTRSPGNAEVCDAADLDEDCDTVADDDDTSTLAGTMTTWYADDDGDGYGDTSTGADLCDAPAGYVSIDEDCDDTDDAVSPAAVEVCFDTVDDDCDGATRCALDTTDATRILTGDDRRSGYAGGSVAGLGDLDGDGVDDVALGAASDTEGGSGAGRAYVALGGTTDLDLRYSARASWRGEAAARYAGSAVAGPGDLSGDGVPDLAVGSYGDADAGSYAGAVYLVSGATTGAQTMSTTSAWAELTGERASEYAGETLADGGDVDGDGSTDLLISATRHNSSAGRTYLFTSFTAGSASLSTATAIFDGESASDASGAELCMAGDIDGDGYDDVLIGAEGDSDGGTNAGAAYVVLGPVSGVMSLRSADYKFTGAAGDQAGSAVAAGDIDGDGYADVGVGASQAGSYGKVHVFLGAGIGSGATSTADATLVGTTGALGVALAMDGDLDGDGYADLAAGNSSESSVSIFLGPFSGTISDTSSDVYMSGAGAFDAFGVALDYIGSQSGTAGQDDLLVGASGYGSGDGAAYVLSSDGL